MAASRTISGSPSFNYAYISTATTTTVKSGSGHLERIVINTTGAGTITIYDSLTGTGQVIAVIKASMPEGPIPYELQFNTGLTIVTAAASDITVVYA